MCRAVKHLLIAVLCAFCLPLRAETHMLEELSALVNDGQCDAAFARMQPLEFDMSGNIEFDLLYAYCALEVGQIGLAMLALERVLAVDPTNQTARAMLARAYYQLNELESARREFALLLSLNPSPALRETISQYLDAIAAADPSRKNLFNGYIELGIGHDTNVTGGSNNDLIFFPSLDQDVPIDPDDLEADDDYSSLAAGGNYLRIIDRNRLLYAGAEMFSRAHAERDDQDYLLSILRTGYRHSWTDHSLGLGLRWGNWRLDGDSYQDFDSVGLNWRVTSLPNYQLGIGVRHDRYRFRQEIDRILDYDDTRLLLALSRLFGEENNKLLGISLETGREDDRNARDDGNMDYILVKASGEMVFSDDWSGFVILSRKEYDYDRENPVFLEKRDESRDQFIAGVSFQIRPKTLIRATLSMTETESSFDIYDISDKDFSLAVRWSL